MARKARKVEKKDVSEVECFNCGAIGLYANKCPQKKTHEESDAEEEEWLAHVTWADVSSLKRTRSTQ